MVALDTTPRQAIERLEQDLGLTPQDLCGALGITRRTLERWRSGESYPQKESRERLTELVELNDALQESFIDIENVQKWMHTEARYLGWATPAEMVRIGRIDRARTNLGVLEHGIYV
jgi:transcriptional regulator with XRE-family HTH domain